MAHPSSTPSHPTSLACNSLASFPQAYSFLERKRDAAAVGCDPANPTSACGELDKLNGIAHELLMTGSVSVYVCGVEVGWGHLMHGPARRGVPQRRRHPAGCAGAAAVWSGGILGLRAVWSTGILTCCITRPPLPRPATLAADG